MLAALLAGCRSSERNFNQPIQLSHVVFNTVDINAAVGFGHRWLVYAPAIGPRTKWPFALQQPSPFRGVQSSGMDFVNHIAYDFRDTDAFQRLGVLRHLGFVPIWGPGRHGPGNNAFAYFGDPVG